MDIAHHKGKRFIWIGGLLYVLFFIRPSFLILPQSVINALQTISFLILIWGSFLVLRAKERHWAWLFLFPVLNLFALLVVFSLKDRSSQESIPFNNEVILEPKKTWIWAGIVPLLFVIGMFVGWARILESSIRPPAIIGSWITTITQTNREVITKIAIAEDNPDICLNVGWTDTCDGGMPCRMTY